MVHYRVTPIIKRRVINEKAATRASFFEREFIKDLASVVGKWRASNFEIFFSEFLLQTKMRSSRCIDDVKIAQQRSYAIEQYPAIPVRATIDPSTMLLKWLRVYQAMYATYLSLEYCSNKIPLINQLKSLRWTLIRCVARVVTTEIFRSLVLRTVKRHPGTRRE